MSEMNETSGRWWTTEGWQDAVCHHDTHVHSLEDTGLSDSIAMFIPAPVDLHVHGGGGHDCMSGDDALRGMLRTHARHGTGAMLATSVTALFDDITRFLDSVVRVMREPATGEATLLGAHLEGPFISPDKLGAQPPYAATLNLEQLELWLKSGIVRVITYAPELDPHGELVKLCTRHNVRTQIGHTVCTWAQAQQALQLGSGVTHLFNAMSGFSHRLGGAATAALACADYAEIITDGIHVERAAFFAAKRAVPNLYGVTDATAAAGMADGDYQLGSLTVTKKDGRVMLPDGTLAGSCLTQRGSLAVLREWGIDWHTIGSLVSAIPAKWIGDETTGQIKAGARSHWIEIQNGEPAAMWLSGERIAW